MVVRQLDLGYSDKFDDVVEGNPQVFSTIGILARWGMGAERFSGKVTIYGDHQGNINATYRDKDGNVTYNIFAQLQDDGSYTTHS